MSIYFQRNDITDREGITDKEVLLTKGVLPITFVYCTFETNTNRWTHNKSITISYEGISHRGGFIVLEGITYRYGFSPWNYITQYKFRVQFNLPNTPYSDICV